MTTNDHPEAGAPGTPGTPEAPPRRPSGEQFFDSVRRIGIVRTDDRWIGGVAAGLGHRYGLDPLLVRGLLILSVFVAGIGLVLYGIAWLLLPEQRDGRIHLQEAVSGTFDVAMVGAGIMVVLGITSGGGIWPWWGGPAEWIVVLLWIAFWAAVVWLVVKLVRSRRRDPRPAPSTWTADGTAPTDPPVASADAASAPTTSAAEAFTPAPRAHYVATPVAPASPAAPDASWNPPPARAAHHRDRNAGQPSAGHVPPSAPLPPVGPPPPPPAPRPRTPRAGSASLGIVVGLSLLLGAGLLAASIALGLPAPTWALWLGGSLVLLGGAIVVTGLRGRRGGGLTALAWLGIVAAAVTWPFAAGATSWDWQDWTWDEDAQIASSSGTVLGQGEIAPTSVDEAAEGYRIQFGDATLDLTGLDLTGVQPGSPVVVPVETTGGRAVVEIPDGVGVEAVVDLNAGRFEWDVDDQHLSVNGFTGGPATYRSAEAETAGAVLLLDVDARAGELVITEENR